MNFKKRIKNKMFWVAIFSFIAITGQTFGLYEVPSGYETWVNAVLMLLIATGVVIDPTTPGIKDGGKRGR